jgi:hypothetical protein
MNLFIICSDSLSCLLAIESCKTQSPFILKIAEIYKSHVAIGKHVIFTWIYDIYDIWSKLPVPSDFDRKNKEFCQLGNAFLVIVMNLLVPAIFPTF